MNRDSVVAKRYAKALFEVAKASSMISQVEEELRLVVTSIQQNDDLQKLLEHPNIDGSAKIGMVKNIFGAQLSPVVMNTVQLLIERGRESVLSDLLTSFVNIANDELGQANAVVYTPFPLTETEASQIAGKFGELTGKTLKLEHVIDSNLLGGFKIRIGDRLYDSSLSGQLARLEKSLKQSQAL